MPFPSYTPRSDSFGNWYFGGFQVDSQVEAGYGAGTGITTSQSEFNAFLNAASGFLSWSNSGNNYNFRFNNSWEPSSSVWRFGFNDFIGQGTYINTAPTGTPTYVTTGPTTSFVGALFNNSICPFAVANQYGMWLVTAAKGTPGQLTTNVNSVYIGWVKDPVFPTNTTERVRNLLAGQGTSNALNGTFVSTQVANSGSLPSYCVTNSVITCNVATPGANVTDLCVLDPNFSYLNIGSLHNAVFCPGTGLTVGRIYRIPPSQDPDGNTEQNIWLCAGQVYGWNGTTGSNNAGYKLIRVWSNNIT